MAIVRAKDGEGDPRSKAPNRPQHAGKRQDSGRARNTADSWDAVFRAMADSHRRRIVAVLCGGIRPAGELAEAVGLAANAVSFHLRWLKLAGLVTVRRDGRSLWYAVEAALLADWAAAVRDEFSVTADTAAAGLPSAVGRGKKDSGPNAGVPPVASGSGVSRRTDIARTGRVRTPRRLPKRPVPSGSWAGASENIATDTLPDELL